MHLTQLSQLVLHWEIVDAHENVLVRVLVVGVHLSDQLHRNHVEHRDDECGLLGEPDSKRGHFVRQVPEIDLEGLLVVLAHLFDTVLVRRGVVLLVAVAAHEVVELALDELGDLGPADPL